jgi:hypothetical protein
MTCESCTYRDGNNLDICKNCPHYDPSEVTKPRWDLEEVDIWEIAKASYQKEILEEWQPLKGKIPAVSDCPKCERYSLQFDAIYIRFECRNKECSLFGKLIHHPSKLFTQIVARLLETE